MIWEKYGEDCDQFILRRKESYTWRDHEVKFTPGIMKPDETAPGKSPVRVCFGLQTGVLRLTLLLLTLLIETIATNKQAFPKDKNTDEAANAFQCVSVTSQPHILQYLPC